MVLFEDARVPVANQIGETNGALRKGEGDSSGDMFGDLELAANAMGICEAGIEGVSPLQPPPGSE